MHTWWEDGKVISEIKIFKLTEEGPLDASMLDSQEEDMGEYNALAYSKCHISVMSLRHDKVSVSVSQCAPCLYTIR